MITGFNTDVDYDGRIFHVQTEDKGRKNPVIESLVYSRGEIVAARNTSYEEFNDCEDYNEDEMVDRMERQHQVLIREILNGKFESDGPKPFGHNIISNRSLDEVVARFLVENYNPDPIQLELVDEIDLLAGTKSKIRLRVVLQEDGCPAEGAQVRLSLVTELGDPHPLFAAATDTDGYVDAIFSLPDGSDHQGDLALLCEARVGDSVTELRQPVSRLSEASA
jgi:hypothetical protein